MRDLFLKDFMRSSFGGGRKGPVNKAEEIQGSKGDEHDTC